MPTEPILIIDSDKEARIQLIKALQEAGYPSLESSTGEEGLSSFRRYLPEIVICDQKLPDMSGFDVLTRVRGLKPDTFVFMIAKQGSIESAIEAIRLGALHYLTKPVNIEELMSHIHKAFESPKLGNSTVFFTKEAHRRNSQHELIGMTPQIRELVRLIDKVAASDASTILLEGESGTGKNLVSRLIHCKSRRAAAPFVEINCASLPENLIESELFGHERGAFTDAKQMKRGLFEMARGGTVFLDEIGEMSLSTQAKLLHAIESRCFRRFGGLEDIETDVRVIASTNIHLKEAVAQKRFREDLYFRLHLIPIQMPSLRERGADIPLLVQSFIRKFNRDYKKNIKGVTPEAETILKIYSWPGNIRELKNVIERIVLLENEEWITLSHLPLEIQRDSHAQSQEYTIPAEGMHLEEIEKQFIVQALNRTSGNQSRAAKLLGITRHTLRYRMEKFGLQTQKPLIKAEGHYPL